MRRKATFAALLFGIAALLASWPGLAASAAAPRPVTVHAPISQSDWFWREQISNIGGQGVAPPSSMSDPSVPAGDLAVAGPEGPDGTQSTPSQSSATQTGPEKETYLAFDMSAVPEGATITAFRLTLPVDPAGGNVNLSDTKIVACAPQQDWSAGSGADSFSGKPTDNCTGAPVVSPGKGDTSFSVNIPALAQTWVQPGGLNFGVAITDSPNNTTTAYQVVFGPSSALTGLTATVSFLPPARTAVNSTQTSSGAAAPSAGSAAALASGSTNASSAGGGGGAPTAVSLPSAAASPLAGTPGGGAAPVLAHSPTPTSTATLLPATSAQPIASFFLAGVGVLLLLLACSLVLGDATPPITGRPERGVRRALRARLAGPLPAGPAETQIFPETP